MGSPTRKRLLLIAFHFPPVQGSSGVHRALAFARYLDRFDWDVTVLTATPQAYPERSLDNYALVPERVRVVRAIALDAQRHLSVLGRYPLALATPDRWRSWICSGVRAGRRLIRDWRPHAILSTFPIPSAHEIGWRLSRDSGLPWIADFRDPMGQEEYPKDERMRQAYWALERRVLEQCSAVTVTTEGAANIYRGRYPAFPSDRIRVIPNGFDEQAFALLTPATSRREAVPGAARFLHSGILYPHERNPDCFFQAIRELRTEGLLDPALVRFDMRGCGHVDRYGPQLARLGIEDTVRLLPALPYREALQEMHEADFLMLFQAASCNSQIPAKLYEYLYLGRPIVGFTDHAGDTGRLLAELGIDNVSPLDDVIAIKALILRVLDQARRGTAFVPPRELVLRLSRAGTTEKLAGLLDAVVTDHDVAGRTGRTGEA